MPPLNFHVPKDDAIDRFHWSLWSFTVCSVYAVTFNFTGNSPSVVNNRVFFNLSFSGGVVAAKCAVLQGQKVLEETDCKH